MKPLKLQRELDLKRYLQSVALLPQASTEQRQAWAQAWAQGESAAGRQLAESFLKLVVAEAAAQRGQGLRFQSLLSLGNKALIQALPSICAQPGPPSEIALRQAIGQALKAKIAQKGRDQGHVP